MMARTSRQLAIAECTQFSAHSLLGDADAELLPCPLAQVDDPPANHAVDGRNGAALDYRGQSRPMGRVQPRRLTRRLVVDEPVWAVSIQLQHPVPDELQRHAADRGRFRPARTVVDRRQR